MPLLPTRSAIRYLLAVALSSSLSACAEQPASKATSAPQQQPLAANQPTTAAPNVLVSTQPAQSFSAWLSELRSEALSLGINAKLLDQAFAGLRPDPSVLKADQSQPEFTRPAWAYIESATSEVRIRKGQAMLREHAATLAAIEQRYGVSPTILVAIWGMESSFGQFMGEQSVIRSLATLAYEGRRQQFAREQLLAALAILQNGDISIQRMRGSWAGAMGQTQFIPTTYNSHAVDFDGDGRRDIWDSSADALASAAHYLQASGWQHGQTWGFEVQLPKNFDYALADTDLRRSLSDWKKIGVRAAALSAQPADAQASLLLPAGHRGPAFLVMNNFRVILRYNNSTAYALAIGLLSERLQNRGQLQASWPKGEVPLSRSQKIALQEGLSAKGYTPGVADGIIGANTRKAVRAYQQSLGWPADGYPTTELLQQLSGKR